MKHNKYLYLIWALLVLFCCITVLCIIYQRDELFRGNYQPGERDCESQKKEEIIAIEKWITTLPEENQSVARKKYLENLQFIPFNWKLYNATDSIHASIHYDSLLHQINALHTPWEKVLLVLKIVYENANQGDYEMLFPELNKRFYSLGAREQFVAFKLNQYAGGCSEYADFTVKLLNEVGIIAAMLNLSSTDDEGTLGLHTLPVCYINEKLFLIDPLFPQYYAIQNSQQPLDFVSMHQLIKSGNSEQIYAAIVKNNGGHYLQPFDSLPCYPFNNGVFGYSNVSACYNLNSAFMLLDCQINNAFADPVLFSKRKITLLKRHDLDINYYSYFYFPAALEGNEAYCSLISEVLSKSGIDVQIN